jgi:hypothetical protein
MGKILARSQRIPLDDYCCLARQHNGWRAKIGGAVSKHGSAGYAMRRGVPLLTKARNTSLSFGDWLSICP